jgi:hypothetical protein
LLRETTAQDIRQQPAARGNLVIEGASEFANDEGGLSNIGLQLDQEGAGEGWRRTGERAPLGWVTVQPAKSDGSFCLISGLEEKSPVTASRVLAGAHEASGYRN